MMLSAGGGIPAASATATGPSRGQKDGALSRRRHPSQHRQDPIRRAAAVPPASGGGGGGSGAGERDADRPPPSLLPLARAAANFAVAAGCACLAVGAPWLASPLPPPPAFALTTPSAPPPGVSVAAAPAAPAPSAAAASSSSAAPPGRDALLVLSSELEDELLRASRELDARAVEALGDALSALRNVAAGQGGGGGGSGSADGSAPSSSSTAAAASKLSPAELDADADGRELLREVWEVVDAAYLDARGAGFDRDAWRAARDRALAAPPGKYADPTGGAARRAAAAMLSRLVRDPYTRLIPPEEFAAMARYDVTGVGLNLGTAEEYVRKTGRALPARVFLAEGGGGREGAAAGAAAAEAEAEAAAPAPASPAPPPPPGTRGVWVVGLSKGSAADVAGVHQGDELVAVDGVRLDSGGGGGGSAPGAAAETAPAFSPFQASALVSGDLLPDGRSADDLPPSAWRPTVRITLRDDRGEERALEVPRRPRQALASPVASRLEVRRRPAAGARGGGGLLASLLPAPASSETTVTTPTTIKVGVLSVSSFNARAQRDVAAALAALRAQGAEALELDLRGNRGGLVSEGLEVARLFVGDGAPLVVTQGAAMAAEPPRAGPGPAPYGDGGSSGGGGGPVAPSSSSPPYLPLTVLVDGHTASASEIVAGALRDNCRAVLAGPGRTYGKGLIQSVYELSAKNGGGIALTVGKYVTPRGVDIDREGLAPDFSRWPVPREEAERVLSACRAENQGRR